MEPGESTNIQWRFPRSKKRRILRKWAANPGNWRPAGIRPYQWRELQRMQKRVATKGGWSAEFFAMPTHAGKTGLAPMWLSPACGNLRAFAPPRPYRRFDPRSVQDAIDCGLLAAIAVHPSLLGGPRGKVVDVAAVESDYAAVEERVVALVAEEGLEKWLPPGSPILPGTRTETGRPRKWVPSDPPPWPKSSQSP